MNSKNENGNTTLQMVLDYLNERDRLAHQWATNRLVILIVSLVIIVICLLLADRGDLIAHLFSLFSSLL